MTPCPICNSDTTIRSSSTQGGVVRRVHKCEQGHRFNTAERIFQPPLAPHVEDDYDTATMEEGLLQERGW